MCHVVVVDVAVAVDERNDCVVVVVIVVNVTVLVVSVAAVVVSFDNVPVTRRESRNIFLPPKKYNLEIQNCDYARIITIDKNCR